MPKNTFAGKSKFSKQTFDHFQFRFHLLVSSVQHIFGSFLNQFKMTLEIFLVRAVEIAAIAVFFLLALTIGAFLWLLRTGLIIFGVFLKPTLLIIGFAVSNCLQVVGWTLSQSVQRLIEFGYKLVH